MDVSTETTVSKPIILIVDDEVAIQQTLRMLLFDQGYDIHTANNGIEGLEAVVRLKPDLILLDIMMPGLDGFEVCKRVRQNAELAEIPVVFVTALSDRESRLRGFTVGADDFITKPFDLAILRSRVRTITSLNRYRVLHKERGKFQRALELMPDGVVILDRSGMIQVINSALARMLSVSGETMVGRSFFDFMAPDEISSLRHMLTRHFDETFRAGHTETVLLGTNDNAITVELTIGDLPWEGMDAVQVVVRDITERKLTQTELANSERRYREAYQSANAMLAETRALFRISNVLTATEDLTTVLQGIAEVIAEVLRANIVHLIMLDIEAEEIVSTVRVGPGSIQPYTPTFPELMEGLTGWVVQNGQPVISPKGTLDEREGALAQRRRASMKSGCIVVVPMQFGEQLLGTITIENRINQRDFSEHDVDLLIAMANQASLAIDRAKLYEQVRMHAADMEKRVQERTAELKQLSQRQAALADINLEVNLPHELQGLLDRIVQLAAELLSASRCAAVVLWDVQSQTSTLASTTISDGSTIPLNNLANHLEPITHYVINNRQSVIVTNISELPLDSCHLLRIGNLWAYAAIPLVAEDKVLGVLYAFEDKPHEYSEDEINFLVALAGRAAIGINRIELYRQLQEAIAELAKLVGEIRNERDQNIAILDALGEAVIVGDTEGRIQYVNPTAEMLTGIEYNAGNESKPLTYDQVDGLEFHRGPIERTLTTGEVWRGEIVQPWEGGERRDIALTVTPLFDVAEGQDSHLSGFVSVARDITLLKEAERLKDQFVSNVSHELRTPLSILALLTGNLATLYNELSASDRLEMIEEIREQSRILNELISDILELSRIDSGSLSTSREVLDFAQLAQAEIEKHLPTTTEKKVELRFEGTAPIEVLGHSGQLRQVIRNIVSNAVKYTLAGGRILCEVAILSADGGADPTAWPGSERLSSGKWASLRVVDTGIGISEDHLSYIFERFYRVNREGNVPGSGLGLSIAWELVKYHGGYIEVASTPHNGSIFAIYLPVFESQEKHNV